MSTTGFYEPTNRIVRLPRVDTPPHLHGLLDHLIFDDPIICLSFLAEQRLREIGDDMPRLTGWMMSAWVGLRAANRVPPLPDDVPLESACLYVVDFWLTVFIAVHNAGGDKALLLEARPPNLAAYRATLRDFLQDDQ